MSRLTGDTNEVDDQYRRERLEREAQESAAQIKQKLDRIIELLEKILES